MKREFQVIYRLANSEPRRIDVIAETEDEARAQMSSEKELRILSVTELWPVLPPNLRTFNREEFGVVLRGSASLVDKLAAAGVLPKSKDRHPIYTLTDLDRMLEKTRDAA